MGKGPSRADKIANFCKSQFLKIVEVARSVVALNLVIGNNVECDGYDNNLEIGFLFFAFFLPSYEGSGAEFRVGSKGMDSWKLTLCWSDSPTRQSQGLLRAGIAALLRLSFHQNLLAHLPDTVSGRRSEEFIE